MLKMGMEGRVWEQPETHSEFGYFSLFYYFSFYVTLAECGRVLSCGSNAFGQLGVGLTVTHTADVQLVEVSHSNT